jgi:two-component system, chemotaxis family, chemotaxis protein CheY
MVVDDDDDIRIALGELLGVLKYEVALAKNGLDALDQLRAGTRPDVILLDLMMPVMDGFEFTAELRKYPGLVTIPVILITAAANAATEAAKINAAGHIQKPFNASELVAVIKRITNQQPLACEAR